MDDPVLVRLLDGGAVVAGTVLLETQHPAVPDGMFRVQIHRPLDERAASFPVAGKGDVRAHGGVAPAVQGIQRDGAIGFVERRGDLFAEQQGKPSGGMSSWSERPSTSSIVRKCTPAVSSAEKSVTMFG
mgnify:CR=1 FL=1